jgi:PEP-CTERM motif
MMKRMFAIGALLAGVSLGMAAAVQAAPIAPFATLTVNGQVTTFDLTADPAKSGRFFLEGAVTTDLYEVFVTATLDADPSILFGITVQNFGDAPLDVGFSLGTPIVPFATPAVATSSLRGTLNPGAGAPAGLSVTPTQGDSDGDGVAELLVNTVADPLTSLGVDVGQGVSLAGGLPAVYGPFSAGPITAPAGLFTFLQADLGFTLTGGGDVADLQGLTELRAIPEPSTIGLLGLGLIALGRRVRARMPHPVDRAS